MTLPERVLLTGDAVGGVWRYSLDLARGFGARGIETVYAVLGPPPSTGQLIEAETVPGLRLVMTGLPLDWTCSNIAELREIGATLAGLARRIGADTVHLHTPTLAAEVPWAVPVVAVAHSCVGTWWKAVRTGPLPEALEWLAAAAGRGLAEADAVIAPSRSFARMLATLYRPGRRIDVVHNGTAEVAPAGLPRARAVLTAGRLWDEGKNIATLDRAAAQIEDPVVAAGPLTGPNGARVEFAHIRPIGVLDAPALGLVMQQATVFVSASRYEPFGLAVLEAARAGMALALADIPTFRELWSGAALFFHPEDPAGIADALRRLLERPLSAPERARACAAKYTLDAMVEGTLAVHAPLLGSQAA